MKIQMPFNTEFDRAKFPPGVVATVRFKSDDKHPPTVVGPDARAIMSQAEIYSGISARVSMRPYAYGNKGQAIPPGVALGLGNLQKLADGPRLRGSGNGSEFGKWSTPGGDSNEFGGTTGFGDSDPLDELLK
jgi:hypothetical protein